MGWSSQNLSNRIRARIEKQLMSRVHALYVIAHENGVNLEQCGVDAAMLIEVGQLATRRTQASQVLPAPNGRAQTVSSSTPARPSPAALFANRELHPSVIRASRKAFTNGLNQDAVRKAFQSLINRVKRLTGTSRDGTNLMGWAFGDPPQLQMSELSTESARNEHDGLRFLMQGAALGIRNPRSHEDHWEHDDETAPVLELLAFASYLHRCVDRCEEFRASAEQAAA